MENRALLNFLFNQRDIDEHNEKYEEGLETFSRGPCEYSDLTQDEVNTFVNGFVKPMNLEVNFDDDHEEEEDEVSDIHERKKRNINEDPVDLNYIDEGYVNDIQDQGLCGSCYR